LALVEYLGRELAKVLKLNPGFYQKRKLILFFCPSRRNRIFRRCHFAKFICGGFWRIFKIAFNANSNFSRLFASGLAISIFAHTAINIGMNLGLLPVIGLPLPLVSYGGATFYLPIFLLEFYKYKNDRFIILIL